MMRSLSNLLSTLEAQYGPAMMVGLLFGLAALLGLIFGASIMGALASASRRRALRESEEEHELLQNLLNDTRLNGSRLQSENNSLKATMASVDSLETKQEREIKQLSTELKAAQLALVAKEKELAAKEKLLVASADSQSGQSPQLGSENTESSEELKQALLKARDQGRREGREAGLKDGLEQGRSEGKQAGLQEGRELGREEGFIEGKVQGLEKTKKEVLDGSAARMAVAAAATPAAVAGASAVAAKSAEPPTLIKRVRSEGEGSLSPAEAGIIPDEEIIPILSEAELTANVEAYDLSDLEDLVSEDL